MKKKTLITILSILGVIILLLAASPKLSLFSTNAAPATPGARADMRLPVSVHILVPERVEDKIRSTGSVIANEEVELRSEIAGKISRIAFREGSSVQRGELLVKIDDSELQAQLLKLQSQEKLAREVENRRRLMFDSKLISSEEYERAVNELNSTLADIVLTKARIGKTGIRAPFDGIVGIRYVSEGSFVSSATRIASLQNISSVKIDFSVPERFVNDVRKGQEIQFRLTGMEGSYTGEIFAIEPKIDPTTRTVLLRAQSSNKDGKIIPGAFAEIELILRQLESALMVPTEAMIPELGGQSVYLLKNGQAQPQRVETGLRTNRTIQLTSGVQAGDTVITSGILQIRPGLPVRLAEETQP
jgi:membrane fusion protein (multidrug efflux system)